MTELRWKGELRTGERITGVKCPHKFCEGRIVYSGNYFCEFSVGVLSTEDATCNFILESDEYDQTYVDGKLVEVLVHAMPPLHKRTWNKIKRSVGLDQKEWEDCEEVLPDVRSSVRP